MELTIERGEKKGKHDDSDSDSYQNLTRDFATVRAIDGLSLEIPAGIIYGFLGPNVAAKTTTINLLGRHASGKCWRYSASTRSYSSSAAFSLRLTWRC